MKRFMILPLLLVLFVSFSANAKGPGKREWEWWKSKRIAYTLDLTKDQTTQINEIVTKFDPILKEARENFVSNKAAFKDAKSNPDASSGDVIKAFDTMWDSRYKMKRVKLDRDLAMKSVLTPAQIIDLSDIRKTQREKMMKRYHYKQHPELKEKTNQ